jgi:hypothetical protein
MNIRAEFQQVDGEGVSKHMRCYGITDAGKATRLLVRLLDGARVDRLAGHIPIEEPRLRPPCYPNKRAGSLGTAERAPSWILLALFDADDHLLAGIVRGLQVDGLGNAQTRGITGGENRSKFRVAKNDGKHRDLLWT